MDIMTISSINIYEWLEKRLPEEKYLHSIGAEETARNLAARFGEDIEKAALSALIHDNAKGYSHNELVSIVNENKFSIDEEVKSNSKILHAYVGAYLAEKELNITGRDIFNAVMFHTTGRVNMTLLEKIVYLSDKMETKTRDFEYTNKIINVLNETNDLDKTILVTIDMTIKSLVDRKLPINIETINLWNQLVYAEDKTKIQT